MHQTKTIFLWDVKKLFRESLGRGLNHGRRRFWILITPRLPRRYGRGQDRERLTLQLACHTFAKDMTPVASSFDVAHDEAAAPQLSGYEKGELLFFNFTGIHDAVVAKVSPSRSD